MADINVTAGGRSGARNVRVWDPLVRLIHWTVVLTVLINSFSDGEGSLHEWAGYIAFGLVGLRLVWGLIGPWPARFSAFPPNPVAAIAYLRSALSRSRVVHLSHNPLGALMVYNIWATIMVLGVTGYMMGTTQFFGVEWVEETHEIVYNWLLLSVVLHVGGVLFDSWRTGVHLIRAMITGRKRIPEGMEIE